MKLIPVKDACNILDVSDKTIRNWIEEGKLDRHEDDKGNTVLDKRQILESKPTVICFFNQKGGVSKTNSAAIMMDYYEKLYSLRHDKDNESRKKKILVVDIDPQSSLSQILFTDKDLYGDIDDNNDFNLELNNEVKIKKRNSNYLTLYDFFYYGESLNNIVRKYNDYIDILPSDILISDKGDVDFLELPKYKSAFYSFFRKYSLVIIDTQPAINSLSRLGILLSNYILCPLVPTDNAFRGLGQAIRTIRQMIPYNRDLIDFKCFLSVNKQSKTNIREYVIEKYRKHLTPINKILNNTMPEFIGIVERETVKQNLFFRYENDSKSKKSIDMINCLMDEIDNIIYNER